MKKVLYLLLVITISASAIHAEGKKIPENSTSEWDFRGELSPFLLGSKLAKNLPQCETYEELRDTLEKVIPELISNRY